MKCVVDVMMIEGDTENVQPALRRQDDQEMDVPLVAAKSKNATAYATIQQVNQLGCILFCVFWPLRNTWLKCFSIPEFVVTSRSLDHIQTGIFLMAVVDDDRMFVGAA